MGTLKFGAYQAVNNCVRLLPDERVVIITDYATMRVAEAIRLEDGLAGGAVSTYVMENYGKRPEDGNYPLHFPDKMLYALEDADVSFFAATKKRGELQSFRHPLLEAAKANLRLRHAHMPDVNEQLMCTGMSVDYAQVQRVSAKVEELVKSARYITVTTPAGTDFRAEFSPAYRWKRTDGIIFPGNWSNLPEGEVFTCVYDIPEGSIVVDGVLGDHFCKEFGLLEQTPLTLDIEGSRIKRIRCDNEKLVEELGKYTKIDENADRIGEFAIGTNVGLDGFVGVMLQDEKYPGVHVAIGHGYPDETGAGWNSEVHCDAVMKDCTIDVDGSVIIRDGKFLFDF